MSTRCTIAHGDNFHFYYDGLDHDHVYLELDTTHFEAGYSHVMIPIPIHIWETIRHLGGARLDLVEKDDGQLLAMVQETVDQRIGEYQQALHENPRHAEVISVAGILPYGAADTPRADQINRALKYFRHERQRQREVKARIDALRKVTPASSSTQTPMGDLT